MSLILKRQRGRFLLSALVCLLISAPVIRAAENKLDMTQTALASQNWQSAIDFIEKGNFAAAEAALNDLKKTDDKTVSAVSEWIHDFREQQTKRKELNKADFDKYSRFSQERIDRSEYSLALTWAIRAADVADDREQFLKTDWLQTLRSEALLKAEQYRREHEWREAWQIYWPLAELWTREPTFKKLERDMLTHLRLDIIFDDEKKQWEDRLEKVRWKDARRALYYIDRLYVKPVDFKEVTIEGLEHLLVLSESHSAQNTFKNLGNKHYREMFQNRIQVNLDRVKKETKYRYSDCVKLFARVIKDINDQTVRLPEELLISELMRGALSPLDEYTTIIWPEETEEFDKHTRGDFVGVGISIIKNAADEIEVVSPLDETPAYKAGIIPGDIITRVDGKSLKGFSLTKTVDTITGEINSEVTLTIRRDGEENDYVLKRDKIKIQSVKGIKRKESGKQKWNHWLDKDMGIGYVRVGSFQSNTVEDLENTILDLKADGMNGLVLDLRGNPGGLLTAADGMTSMFLEKGSSVVSTSGRNSSDDQIFVTPRDGTFDDDLELVVLVDEHSASASEIVSGAIRDNDRGVVIGERTFGKFSVQNLIPLNNESKAKLKITTAKYFLPSGASLHRDPDSTTWGVEPDIKVRLVNKEQLNVYQMRRESDVIKASNEKDEDEEGESKQAKAAKEEEEKQAELEKEMKYQRFLVRGRKWYDLDVSSKKDEEGKETDELPTVKLNNEEVTLTAKDEHGKKLVIKEIKRSGDRIKIVTENSVGEPTEAETLFVGTLEVKKDRLPILIQEDENKRPKIDPQLDTALLVMRINLTDKNQGLPVVARELGDENVKTP